MEVLLPGCKEPPKSSPCPRRPGRFWAKSIEIYYYPRDKLPPMPHPAHDLSRFSFGITSAIVTSLALMLGLDQTRDPKTSIIGALLLIAIADNVADSLGIHIYRESVPGTESNPRINTISNFATRLGVMMLFVAAVYLLPLTYAIAISVAAGLALLTILSYYIALNQKTSIAISMVHHVGIAIIVIFVSHFLGTLIGDMFRA